MSLMLFFELKTNQKLILYLMAGTMLLISCSPSKKVNVSSRNTSTHKRVLELDTDTIEVFNKDVREIDRRAKETEDSKREPDTKADKVISTARTFIGTPYKYGGTTRSGMDCSGLLINSFNAVKVNLPRSSAAQSKVGTEIKKMSELKPGDLVFFATGDKKKQITHVGLVTDVKSKDNIKFIHASSKLGVVETNLFAEYYQKRFRGARRVID